MGTERAIIWRRGEIERMGAYLAVGLLAYAVVAALWYARLAQGDGGRRGRTADR